MLGLTERNGEAAISSRLLATTTVFCNLLVLSMMVVRRGMGDRYSLYVSGHDVSKQAFRSKARHYSSDRICKI